MNSHFIFDEDEQPKAKGPIYLCGYEGEDSTPNSTPHQYPESNCPDSYNAIYQLIASQLEIRLIISTATVP